jgi:hypothetical protein
MPDMPEEFAEYGRVAKRVSEKTRYPIRNFNQLADALGGQEADVDVHGEKVKVGRGRGLLNKNFFPIESEEELVATMATVDVLRPGYEPPDTARGQEERPDEGRTPPTRDVKDLPLPDGLEGGPSLVKGRR